MRQLATLTSESDARRLVDYLLTLDIVAKVDADGDGWAVWVRQEDQLEQARRELAEFQDNPQADRYRAAAGAAAQRRRVEARRDAAAQKNLVDLRRRWDVRGTGRTPVTWLLIAASLWLTWQSSFGQDAAAAEALSVVPYESWVRLGPVGALVEQLAAGHLWRLFTPMFLHLGPMHIVFNVLMMLDFGRRTEAVLGLWRYVLLVLGLQLAATLAQYFAVGPHFGGISGVVYGLLGYAWVQSKFGGHPLLYISPSTWFIAIIWAVIGLTSDSGIANGAHFGGLAAGIVAGWLPIGWRRLTRR